MKSTRTQAANIFVTYLVLYPLGEKRLQTHLDFIMSNLSYDIANGRYGILEVLNLIFSKFPAELLSKFAKFFYFPLVLALANDEDPNCRKMLAHVCIPGKFELTFEGIKEIVEEITFLEFAGAL